MKSCQRNLAHSGQASEILEQRAGKFGEHGVSRLVLHDAMRYAALGGQI